MPSSEGMRIPFYRHDIGETELESVKAVFDTPILTTGDFTEAFENYKKKDFFPV